MTDLRESLTTPQPISCMAVHPQYRQLTLLEWLGLKNLPSEFQVPQRLYVACGDRLYVSDNNGNFKP